MGEVKLPDAGWELLAPFLGGCTFREDIADASMCLCGIPALGHDQAVARYIAIDNPTLAAVVEHIQADAEAAGARKVTERVEAVLNSEQFTYYDQFSKPAISGAASEAIRAALLGARGA